MAKLIGVSPYAEDELALPVASVDTALSFYEDVMGFRMKSKNEEPCNSAILVRNEVKIGLAENGGDPSQEGCFFEVDDVEGIFSEFKANGLKQEEAKYRVDRYGDVSYKVFFVVAPDGLCYCLGERQP
jgi:catechol 2,3-dioxygenase-like lactoylglutathione lyase family enzyme